MNRINLLNSNTTNKIAAGEVVERPYSVVKELVENSIDAGSKNITVEIVEGGQKSIKVSDDGIGIHPNDIEKAFTAHATSKIRDVEDIYSINTLGFRGEALASISAVSNCILRSRNTEFDSGKEIALDAGKINYIKEIGCKIGTSIQVENLFFNVPARQKFLKSPQREAALISDMLVRLALSNSDVSLKYFKNGKTALTTYATDNVKDTIRNVYGKEVYNNITSFEKHNDIVSVYGYIGSSDISKGSRNRQSIFVNNRLIKNRLITVAVENAFKSFLTINKFPFFVLFIDIYPEYIDVNIHPTKSEIKFQDDRVIYKIVFDAVHEALRESLRNSFDIKPEKNNDELSGGSHINEEEGNVKNIKDLSNLMNKIPIDLKSPSNIYDNENKVVSTNSIHEQLNTNLNSYENMINNTNIDSKNNNYQNNNKKIYNDNNIYEQIESSYINQGNDKFLKLNVIGQYNKTYIIAEGYNNLYLIDQHAAHEKILFEKYRNDIKNSIVASQVLLTPVVKELSYEDFEIYTENKDIFINSGFRIELFGENTINIKEVPIIFGKPDVNNLFDQIILDLKNMGNGKTSEIKYNSIARMACRAAIKAHDKLSEEEMVSLIGDLKKLDDPFTCPHGRPTIIEFSLYELEKKFKRIQ